MAISMAITQTPGPEMLSLKQQAGEENLHTFLYTVRLGVNMENVKFVFLSFGKAYHLPKHKKIHTFLLLAQSIICTNIYFVKCMYLSIPF